MQLEMYMPHVTCVKYSTYSYKKNPKKLYREGQSLTYHWEFRFPERVFFSDFSKSYHWLQRPGRPKILLGFYGIEFVSGHFSEKLSGNLNSQ